MVEELHKRGMYAGLWTSTGMPNIADEVGGANVQSACRARAERVQSACRARAERVQTHVLPLITSDYH